jgi:hypothetical protein
MAATPTEERLAVLHSHYIWRINAAVAAGRMDLVRDLADEYHDEAVNALLTLEGDSASNPDFGPAEILEFGGGTPYRRGVGRPGTWRFRFSRRNSR